MRIVFILLLLSLAPSLALADHHYTFEHAQEMYDSGRIDWLEYSAESFELALEEDKPIFLLISAPSWCYWCHVYTSDSYVYHEAVYPIINEQFIPIYVDADKRQDVTRQHLEGGWPSTTVFTPSKERLFGFSGPRPIENMIANLNLAIDHVKQNEFSASISYEYEKRPFIVPTATDLETLVFNFQEYILRAYDPEHGGFGNGQKFPQAKTLDYALTLYEDHQNSVYLNLVRNTLENQYTDVDKLETDYNLFDPVEGGFHRYGTTREWSPPHYEKMLYDNAGLLKAYAHLRSLDEQNDLAREVVAMTDAFVQREWLSPEGPFYGNSDVHGEHHYYAKKDRGTDKPRVEKTFYTDWNAQAIDTYFYLYSITGDESYRDIAVKALDFFAENMISPNGVYHYYNEDGKGVTGNLLDNAYLTLAFVKGYESTGNALYLDKALELAEYSLAHLYDWHSGGFFERHSLEKEIYAPGEHVLLSKPLEENSVLIYSFLKLYEITDEEIYLDSALKSMGYLLSGVGGLDRGYYYIVSAEHVLEYGYLDEYASLDVSGIMPSPFWLDELLEAPEVNSEFVASDEGLDTLQGSWALLILVSLFAGLLSFVSPCTLPILPAYLATTLRSNKKSIGKSSVFFFLGVVCVFVFLGIGAALLGDALNSRLTYFSQVAGIAVIVFGVFMLLGRGFSGIKINPKDPTTSFETFVFGAAIGVSWTPCVGPILVAILLLASLSSSAFLGGLLLFSYGIGLSLPLLLVSRYLQKAKHSIIWSVLKGRMVSVFGYKIHSSSLIAGLLFVLLGVLMASGILFSFNQYLSLTGVQKFLFGIEEWLLGIV